jgi:hypothetical protein
LGVEWQRLTGRGLRSPASNRPILNDYRNFVHEKALPCPQRPLPWSTILADDRLEAKAERLIPG